MVKTDEIPGVGQVGGEGGLADASRPTKSLEFSHDEGLQLWLQLSHCRPTAVSVLSLDDSTSSGRTKLPACVTRAQSLK